MDNKFTNAFNFLIEHEGGFINDPVDDGGATNFGISLRFYKLLNKDATKDDIENLTLDDARKIYYEYWWVKYNYNSIDSYDLVEKIFDFSVNMGPSQAHKLLQSAVNCFFAEDRLAEDGIIGTETIAACNEITNPNLSMHEQHVKNLINYYTLLACKFYLEIASLEEDNYRFLKGWLHRATDNTELSDIELNNYHH